MGVLFRRLSADGSGPPNFPVLYTASFGTNPDRPLPPLNKYPCYTIEITRPVQTVHG